MPDEITGPILMPPHLEVRTWDHPGACGRIPQPDEEGWAFQFLLEGGSRIRICMGRATRDAFRDFLAQDEMDDVAKRLLDAS